MTAEDHATRFQIYRESGTVKTMAKKAGISHSGFREWMNLHGLKAHTDLPPRARPEGVQTRGPAYVHDRPEWERDRMRHFLSKLIAAADTFPTKQRDVGAFVDTYQTIYGCAHKEALHG